MVVDNFLEINPIYDVVIELLNKYKKEKKK